MNSDFALAVHCLILLAYFPDKLLTSAAISKSFSVHAVRVRKTLSLLKKSGFIESREGVKGGFLINCDLSSVTLEDIYKLTQKDVLKPKCHACKTCCEVGADIEDVLDDVFKGADEKLHDYLRTHTLDMVLKKVKKK